jgi:uracil-DNA glycosylase
MVTETNLIQETKEKLISKLEPSGWAEKLRLFLNSEDFVSILNKLHTEVLEDKRFTPGLKYVFSAFENCPWDTTKVVFIGQDPYFTLGVADGMAFSCSITKKAQPSLKYMFQAIEELVPFEDRESTELEQNPDLTRWANQGILLLNSAFTTQIGKPATHYDIWKDFIVYVIDTLCSKKNDLIFVLMGKQAESFGCHIHNQQVIYTSHPASAAYQKAQSWNGGPMFNAVNESLKEKGLPTIKW